jgi:hypothetical protein
MPWTAGRLATRPAPSTHPLVNPLPTFFTRRLRQLYHLHTRRPRPSRQHRTGARPSW